MARQSCLVEITRKAVEGAASILVGSNKILVDSILLNFIDNVVIQIKDIIELNRLFH